MISIALCMFYDVERFPNLSSEERKQCTNAEQWMLCFNVERLRKEEKIRESPPKQTYAAWNPAWKRNKKKKNKRKQ
jgi:hypothetical protein